MGNLASSLISSNSETSVPSLPPINVCARKMDGSGPSLAISPSESVFRLKELLSPHFVVHASQLKLVFGNDTLHDQRTLADSGVNVDAELAVVIMPPIPDWAAGLGLTYEHPVLLRDYYSKHGLDIPEACNSDDGVWNALKSARESALASKRELNSWNHLIELTKNGQAALEIHVAPSQKVEIGVKGDIWNNNGDTCIHQLMLVMDKQIIGELSDGVPGRGRKIKKDISFVAPSELGTYMLWKKGDLQYSMRDARRNCENEMGGRVKARYPDAFVGWLIVS